MNEDNLVDVTENINNEIKSNNVVLFMKGTQSFLCVVFLLLLFRY